MDKHPNDTDSKSCTQKCSEECPEKMHLSEMDLKFVALYHI